MFGQLSSANGEGKPTAAIVASGVGVGWARLERDNPPYSCVAESSSEYPGPVLAETESGFGLQYGQQIFGLDVRFVLLAIRGRQFAFDSATDSLEVNPFA